MQLDTENEMQDMETVKFTEHIVSDADSLYGLSLQYNIPIEILRKFNNLSTDEIYFCKVIKIPESNCNYQPESINLEELEKNKKINYFQRQLEPNDQNRGTAKFYLESVDYDLEQALVDYKNDLEFEKMPSEGYKKFN